MLNRAHRVAAVIDPASEGGAGVLLNCGHGGHAVAVAVTEWSPRLQLRLPVIKALRAAPAGCEILYDYRAVTNDPAEYDDLALNPLCGCGCGGRLLSYDPSIRGAGA